MSKKENPKPDEQEPAMKSSLVKEVKRYTGENKPELLNKAETGIRQSRGKKQRRQFKLAPNREEKRLTLFPKTADVGIRENYLIRKSFFLSIKSVISSNSLV